MGGNSDANEVRGSTMYIRQPVQAIQWCERPQHSKTALFLSPYSQGRK